MYAKSITGAMALAAALALSAPPTPAEAQQNQQRGLVNVAVFEVIDNVTVVVEDVNVSVGVAANIAANVCGVSVPVAVLAEQVVIGGEDYTCTNQIDGSGVTITQR